MQKLQDSVFSIVKTTNLSPAVFNFLQPSEDNADKCPIGGILKDTRHGWLALGPKFCVVDLRTGLKVAARIFGSASNPYTQVTSVVELPTPLTPNSQQLVISLQCEDTGLICVLHVNGSQILRCIQTEAVITELSVCDAIPDGPLTCFDGVVMCGTKNGEILAFDLNREALIQALKDISQGYEHLLRSELTPANLVFLPLKALRQIDGQRDLALENDDHLALLLNESSFIDSQYIFRNPDDTVRMKAKRDHIRVTVVEYIPQLGSLAVGYNFGAFQIWNMLTLDLEFTSQVNVECMPVTHFGFQEPCDDPRAFCYLWVVFSVIDRFEEEEFPLAVMYSLTYQGKRMLSDTKCLYQEFSNATIRFQLELGGADDNGLLGGKCVSCHTYSVNSTLGAEGEDSMLNICQLVWECWGENANLSTQYGMLLFDLDQWYKDQMPATYRLESNAFMSTTWCSELGNGSNTTLDVRLDPNSVSVYCHATRLEEHFFPNSLQYTVRVMSGAGSAVLGTAGIQRQLVSSLHARGPSALLRPTALYRACAAAGLAPTHLRHHDETDTDEQRRFLLSVALEARLSRFLKRCAHDWATGSHSGAGCTLPFLVDWCWTRAIELKENAKELTAPLFVSSALPDRNVVRCLEHCVQQLTQLTGLMDAIITKCCNLVVPDALSEMEEKYKGIGTVSLYFQVVQWFLRVGLLPERNDAYEALPYPAQQLYTIYNKRRLKLNRLQDTGASDELSVKKSCPLLYIDQLIEHEFGGDRIHQIWIKGGSECHGLYPPPSLYSLLRLYLLPDIPEEHKHSLVLYLLVDYSMVYDDVRYEAVIRRLMQFPTMFGLSNTAIKATQAFWHLDHRDFDFALDQLQCLTGNTLSGWQHHVVLSSLLAQKKTQAALQYLHVRKPTPVNSKEGHWSSRGSEQDKLEDWQSCCNLYLARGLVFEALDVVRACVNSSSTTDDKVQVLNYFFKGCRNTGNLSKILQITLEQFEEEVFIKYLENCNDTQSSDILIMYYLQHARYLEASRACGVTRSRRVEEEEEADAADAAAARLHLVDTLCAALPDIATHVARAATHASRNEYQHHKVVVPKPMSVYVQAKSPKNTYTYKSSFIQDTIENASETWMNRPKMRKGIKRALDIEETPFICTPKLIRTRSIFTMERQDADSSPPKRARLATTPSTPAPPAAPSTPAPPATPAAAALSRQMAALLHVPELNATHYSRSGAGTPHSILKIRRNEDRDAASPVDSRYLGDSDDELLETASNHTHYSDSTNKHLRFTIPTASESGSTPSPTLANSMRRDAQKETERSLSPRGKETDIISNDSYATTTSRFATENTRVLESPPKIVMSEETAKSKKPYKDNVRARRSLSASANSSLTDTSMESIADLPVTLINPRYSGEKRRRERSIELENTYNSTIEITDERDRDIDKYASVKEKAVTVPSTPKGRRSIRSVGESTPLANRSQIGTPERQDSPVVTPLRSRGNNRSRSRTPELSPRSSALASIPEQPKQELASEPHATKSTLSVPRQLRSRSRTPERADKGVSESPKLEPISESPTKSSNTGSSSSSPSRRSLRSRSRTPEVEVVEPKTIESSPRSLRSRSKTPEKLLSPKMPQSARKKPLSRLVLEANTFAKTKQTEKTETGETSELACTPVKTNQTPSLLDVTLSPITNKSVLQSPNESELSETVEQISDKTELGLKTLPAFTTIHETFVEKSVLRSYQSSVADASQSIVDKETVEGNASNMKSIPAFTTINVTENKSVLRSYESTIGESSSANVTEDKDYTKPAGSISKIVESYEEKSVLRSYRSANERSSLMTDDNDDYSDDADSRDSAAVIQKEKERIVEIQREINEIEGDISEEDSSDDEAIQDIELIPIVDEPDDDATTSEEFSDEESNSGHQVDVISIDSSSEDAPSGANAENAQKEDKVELEVQDGAQTSTLMDANVKTNIQAEVVVEHSDDSDGARPAVEPDADNDILTDDESEGSNQSLGDLHYSAETVDNDSSGQDEDVSNQGEPDIQERFTVDKSDTSRRPRTHKDASPISAPDEIDSAPSNVDVQIISTNQRSEETKSLETAGDGKVSEDKMDVEEPTIAEKVSSEPVVETVAGKKSAKAESKDAKKSSEVEQKQTEKTDEVKITKTHEVQKQEAAITSDVDNKKTSDVKAKKLDKKEEVSTNDAESAEISKTAEAGSENIVNKADSKNKEVAKTTDDENMDTAQLAEKEDIPLATTEEKPASRTTKRTKSASSNKSTDDTQTPKRKRTQSTSSNKSIIEPEQTTPENATPSRRRAKTPTSAEIRKIVTRRVSKETGEKLEDYKALDETLTPRRRSARSRSKNIDDNESVVSESSVTSNKSKVSEDADSKPSRKGKKSILATKTDLSVIPEVIAEENSKDASEAVAEYSTERRLTRTQQAAVKSWLEPKPAARASRRTSTASKASVASAASIASVASVASAASVVSDDEDASSTHSAFDVQPIDRISLLNKPDFEGTPDVDELQNMSPVSTASDLSRMRRSNFARAASESKITPKAAKIGRRVSVDVVVTPEQGSTPGEGTSRGRRASFNRACEKIHTPKGRRTSTDVRRGEDGSTPESPVVSEATSPRRARRASTHSNTSATSHAKSDTSKRSKKMPALDEDKDSHKK